MRRLALLSSLLGLTLLGCPGSETTDGGIVDAGDVSDDVPGLDAPGVDAALPDAPRDAPPRDAGDLSELSETERMLVDLPAGSWLRVDAGFEDVCESEPGDDWHATSGCGAVTAYSGGVWDPDHRLMLIWGGGHNDYAGNEVYAFSTRTFTWERLGPPSPGPYDRDILTDGRPVSRHTYDGLTFLTGTGRMWAVGGSSSFSGGATSLVWTYDPLTDTFENDARAATQPIYFESSAVYDPVTERVYLKSGEQFYVYDPGAGTWETPFDFGSPPNWPRYSGGAQRGVLDTSRRLIFFIGGGLYMVYDIDAEAIVTDDWVTTGGATFDNVDAVGDREGQRIVTGGGDVISPANAGIDYDVSADQLVAWTGNALWELDLSTRSWRALPTDGAPLAGPEARFEQTRIYGRWRYIDRLNVFVLVEGPGEVWFYKHTPGG